MRILVALPRFPYPIEKGDKLRAFRQLEGLAVNHEIHLIALNHEEPSAEDLAVLRKICKSVNVVVSKRWKRIRNLFFSVFTRKPFQVHYFKSTTMRKRILIRAEEIKADVLYVQLIRLGLSIPDELKIPKYIDYMDSFSIGMEKRIPLTPWYKKTFARLEAKRLRSYERNVMARFQGFSMITEADLDGFKAEDRIDFDVIPNGVSDEYLDFVSTDAIKKYDIIFTGNLGYHPNIQAAVFLVKEILPLIEKIKPGIKVCLAGVRPSSDVRALASDQVEVTGFVEDLKEYMAASKLFVAPMISGSGLQNKLLESMAMGMPTVTSELANRALGAQSGIQLLECQTAEQFAAEIIRLLDRPEEAAEMAANGKAFVKENFLWQHANGLLEAALLRIVRAG